MNLPSTCPSVTFIIVECGSQVNFEWVAFPGPRERGVIQMRKSWEYAGAGDVRGECARRRRKIVLVSKFASTGNTGRGITCSPA